MSNVEILQYVKAIRQQLLTRVGKQPISADLSYDAAGNLTQIIITDKVTGQKLKIEFTYDAAGNLVKIDQEWL